MPLLLLHPRLLNVASHMPLQEGECLSQHQGATMAPQKPSEMFSKKSPAPLVPSVVALISVNPILGSDGVSCELDVSRGRGRLRPQSAVPIAAPK